MEFATAHPGLGLVERKRLMASLIAGIVVEAPDPVNRKAPVRTGASEGEIRTRAYRVNVSLATRAGSSRRANPLRPVRSENGVGSPDGGPQGWLTLDLAPPVRVTW
jgi:hypothetical protein